MRYCGCKSSAGGASSKEAGDWMCNGSLLTPRQVVPGMASRNACGPFNVRMLGRAAVRPCTCMTLYALQRF